MVNRFVTLYDKSSIQYIILHFTAYHSKINGYIDFLETYPIAKVIIIKCKNPFFHILIESNNIIKNSSASTLYENFIALTWQNTYYLHEYKILSLT